MAEEYYGTPGSVIDRTGIRPTDLGVDDDAELTGILEGWLREIRSIIDHDRRRDFLEEADGNLDDVPNLVHGVANRMAANMVALTVLRRETPIVTINSFTVKMVEDRVLTEDIRRDLALIQRGRTKGPNPVRFWRVRTGVELEEALEEAPE